MKCRGWIVLAVYFSIIVRPAVASAISDANVLACDFSANNVARVSRTAGFGGVPEPRARRRCITL
jgi:hypothetical protein